MTQYECDCRPDAIFDTEDEYDKHLETHDPQN